MTSADLPGPPRRKRYGQNFLSDPNVIRRIVDTIDPRPTDHLIEIGPGRGALTDHLVDVGAPLDLIEIDRDLVRLLRERYRGRRVTIHEGDVLQFRFAEVACEGRLRIVGNLPYNISTPLLFHLLSQSDLLEDMHLMVQREVADRLVARPGTGNYGRLGIMAGYYCEIERCFAVPPTAFRPRPRVYSAVVRCVPYRELPLAAMDSRQLHEVVTQAFNQRRKVLRNSLRALVTEQELKELGIDPRARAETLGLEQFVMISDYLVKRGRS